jgi:hypothetical protein
VGGFAGVGGGHASMDKYRHISKKYKIIKVIKGMSTF